VGLGRWIETGLFVSGNLATIPATAGVEICQIFAGNSGTAGDFGVQYSSWSNYQTSGTQRGLAPIALPSVYLIGRVNGTTCAFDMSIDGIGGWETIASNVAAFTPVSFGWTMNNVLNATDRGAIMHWFRVLATGAGSSTFGANLPGRTQQILVS
jgi:hypothetical protein